MKLIFLFFLGLFVGSFLNCVIYRLEKKKSFLSGKSSCPKCKKQLKWFDLIPVLSFILLKGKCRYCKKKISLQYPLVELGTGFVFLFAGIYTNTYIYIFYLLIASCFLICIFVYDLKHFLIPDKLIYPLIVLSFLFMLLNYESFLNFFLSGILSALFFFSLWFFSKGKWMGFGDVKLALFMGFFLGSPKIVVALFSSFLFGALVGLFLIVLKKKKLKSEVPFGPFLVFGTFLGLFLGKEIITWYFSLL